MRRLCSRAAVSLCLCVGIVAGAPGVALAQSPATVDCYHHNGLTGQYTVAQLQAALSTMSPSVREYSPCYQIIQDQLFRQLGKPVPGTGHAGAGGSGGSSTPWALIVVIVVIVLAGGGLAMAAARRRGGGGGGGGMPPAAPAG